MKAMYPVCLLAAAFLALNVPACASKMDSRIESSAKQSHLFKTFLKSDDIKVTSLEGVVILTGSVSEDSHKSLAGDTVSNIKGVKSVDNRLVVTGAPTANSDAWLSDKLKISLLFHRSVSVGKADVEVKDGTVTLRGQAISEEQKELTTQCAQGIEGVKEVRNEMTVAPTFEPIPAIPAEKIDDASITAQVKMVLLLHRSTSVLEILVATKKGVVTLDGKAENEIEKEMVTKLVNDINGVKRVKNRMIIVHPDPAYRVRP